jgi:hypothetical protein
MKRIMMFDATVFGRPNWRLARPHLQCENHSSIRAPFHLEVGLVRCVRGLKFSFVIGQKAEIGPNPFTPKGRVNLVLCIFKSKKCMVWHDPSSLNWVHPKWRAKIWGPLRAKIHSQTHCVHRKIQQKDLRRHPYSILTADWISLFSLLLCPTLRNHHSLKLHKSVTRHKQNQFPHVLYMRWCNVPTEKTFHGKVSIIEYWFVIIRGCTTQCNHGVSISKDGMHNYVTSSGDNYISKLLQLQNEQ